LRGESEAVISKFFKEPLIRFLESREEMHVECHKNRLIFFKKKDTLSPVDIEYVEKFAEEFIKHAK
jgi:hypothetical protein